MKERIDIINAKLNMMWSYAVIWFCAKILKNDLAIQKLRVLDYKRRH